MKFSVLQENLLEALQTSIRFCAHKNTLPVLSGIHITQKGNNLTFRSTDLRSGCICSLSIKNESLEPQKELETIFVVPGKTILEFVSSLKPGKLEVSLADNKLFINSGKTRGNFPLISPEDFPPFPQYNGNFLTLTLEKFLSSLNSVLYAASLDETRPILASIFCRFEEKSLILASTDGYRLSVTNDSIDYSDEPLEFLLPARALSEVSALLAKQPKNSKLQLAIVEDQSQAFLNIGNIHILIRLTEGKFPPYSQVIPSNFLFSTTIDTALLSSAIKTALIFARETSSIISLTFDNNVCIVNSAGSMVGENETRIDVGPTPSGTHTVSFNGKFLLDTLSHLDSDTLVFSYVDELKPSKITPEGKDWPVSVIMPFKR